MQGLHAGFLVRPLGDRKSRREVLIEPSIFFLVPVRRRDEVGEPEFDAGGCFAFEPRLFFHFDRDIQVPAAAGVFAEGPGAKLAL